MSETIVNRYLLLLLLISNMSETIVISNKNVALISNKSNTLPYC